MKAKSYLIGEIPVCIIFDGTIYKAYIFNIVKVCKTEIEAREWLDKRVLSARNY